MKKISSLLLTFCLTLVLTMSLFPNITAQAAAVKTYTVTLRAGNVATFNVDAVNDSIQEGQEASVKEVTANYIKLNVEKGVSLYTAMNEIFESEISGAGTADGFITSVLRMQEGYTYITMSSWGPADTDTVTRNTEYVVDYGVIVNPVVYTVYYLDAASGAQIATPMINYGSDGATVTIPVAIISEYGTTNSTVELVLNANDTAHNNVTFYYTYTGVTYVPGVTTYETQYNDVTETVVVPGAVVGGGGAVTPPATPVIEDEPTPLTPGEDGADGADGTDGADDVDGQVDIDDEDTPLAGGEDDPATIDDEDTPLAAGEEGGVTPLEIGLFATGIALLVVAIVVVTFVLKKRKTVSQAMDETDRNDQE